MSNCRVCGTDVQVDTQGICWTCYMRQRGIITQRQEIIDTLRADKLEMQTTIEGYHVAVQELRAELSAMTADRDEQKQRADAAVAEHNKNVEVYASIAHDSWTRWMEYVFEVCLPCSDGGKIIPQWAIKRWERQMGTPYAELPEPEKESDREEARRYLGRGEKGE